MDDMIIRSKLFTGIISKVISRSLKKKIGSDCDIKVNEIVLTNDGEMTCVKLNIEGSVETSKIPELVKDFI